MSAYTRGVELDTVPEFSGDDRSIRRQAALFFLNQPLASDPGSAVTYSNAGYVVASAVLEHVTRKALPDILAERVFRPLGMEAFVGEPRSISPDGLIGHYLEDGTITPFLDDEPSIPVFLHGAGYVSLNTGDYARYVQAHLCALMGRSSFLSKSAALRLHGREPADRAPLGWGVTELGGATVSFHVGGTGDFTAYMAVSETQDRAAVAVVNAGGEPAAAAQRWLVATMTPD